MHNGTVPFRVVYAQADIDQIAAWIRRAIELGIREEVSAALKHIGEQLTNRPLEWGDPYYNLQAMGLRMCRGWYAMFHVYYGVDETSRIVYISEYRVAPGHVLGQSPPS